MIELQKQSSYYKHQLHEHQLIISDKTQQLNQQLDQLEVQEIRISELQQTLDERVELSNELYRGLQVCRYHGNTVITIATGVTRKLSDIAM